MIDFFEKKKKSFTLNLFLLKNKLLRWEIILVFNLLLCGFSIPLNQYGVHLFFRVVFFLFFEKPTCLTFIKEDWLNHSELHHKL